MKTRKESIIKIDKIPESKIRKGIDFMMSLKKDKCDQELEELMNASESSTNFWYNEIDDEVWNNV